jgi:hypothetical protein
METITEGRVEQLSFSLLSDAGRGPTTRRVDTLEQAVAAYKRLYDTLQRTIGYPYLYMQAWVTLIQCVEQRQWRTLDAIDGVFDQVVVSPDKRQELSSLFAEQQQQQISVWHLKSVVYVWAHLQPAGEDSSEELTSYINYAHAFVNMSPTEAATKLVQTCVNQPTRRDRPYLLRISTKEAGVISMSFVTPVSNRVAHYRIRSTEALQHFVESRDIYQAMISAYLPRDGSPLDSSDLSLVMLKLDPQMNRREVDQKLSQYQARTVSLKEVYSILRGIFFPGTNSYQLLPSGVADSVGLTESYRDSYVSLSSHVNCFQADCGSTAVSVKDPLCNRLYCSDTCYRLDLINCY